MGIELRDYQMKAVKQMKNGCILCGGVGSGKSRTALAYYYLLMGGQLNTDEYTPMSDPPLDLYIITTARKRDQLEWDEELAPFMLTTREEDNIYKHKVTVDSWNNIKKYSNIIGAFFIFDEQRVIGSGAWVKAFLKIAKKNKWILLSATPGDTWSDYIPVFVANGFYKNKTEFTREHIVWSRFTKFPMIDRYINTGKLLKYRNDILIPMDFKRKTTRQVEYIYTDYDEVLYKLVMKKRWDVYKNKPIENAGELCYILRKVVNSDESRIEEVKKIVEDKGRVIIFYNFDYELEALKSTYFGDNVKIAEWNGHKHEPVPKTKRWVYLVQYAAGAEAWNCITTDTIIFYSQNYSYKVMEQASGRIDRMNTPYLVLFYYNLRSHANIDLAISRALKNKKNFNERLFAEGSK